MWRPGVSGRVPYYFSRASVVDMIPLYGTLSLTYTSSGQDTAYIIGGSGIDRLTVNLAYNNFTLVDESGRVLYTVGSGGTYLVVKELERITVLGTNGQVLFSLNTTGSAPALLLLLN